MKPLNKFPEEFFDKYSDKPVKLLPFKQDMQDLADKYIDQISNLLSGLDFKIRTIGSVAYRIPTSDVEISVYIPNNISENILKIFENKFGEPIQNEVEFARFEILNEKYEFDIHVYSGYEAEVSEKLTQYMIENSNLIEEYKKN